ncbi:hypothetical protein ACHAXS_007468 [Conticribra weissflogii]
MSTAMPGAAPPQPPADSSSPSVNHAEVLRDVSNNEPVNETAAAADCALAGAVDDKKNGHLERSDAQCNDWSAPFPAVPTKQENICHKGCNDQSKQVAGTEENQGNHVDLGNENCKSSSSSANRTAEEVNIVKTECVDIRDAENVNDNDGNNGIGGSNVAIQSNSNSNNNSSIKNNNNNQENPTAMDSNDTTTELGSELDLDLLNDIARDFSSKRSSDEVMESPDPSNVNVNEIIDGALNGDSFRMDSNSTKNDNSDGNNASSPRATEVEGNPSESAQIQEADTSTAEIQTNQVEERVSDASQSQSSSVGDFYSSAGSVSTYPTPIQDIAPAAPSTPVTKATSASAHGPTQLSGPNNVSRPGFHGSAALTGASESMQTSPDNTFRNGVNIAPSQSMHDPIFTQSEDQPPVMMHPKPTKGK